MSDSATAEAPVRQTNGRKPKSEWISVSSPNADVCGICGHKTKCTYTTDRKIAKCYRIRTGSFKTKDDDIGTAHYHRLADGASVADAELASESDVETGEPISDQRLDEIYSRFLQHARGLNDQHAKDSINRGMTAEHALEIGYRSLDRDMCQSISDALHREFKEDLFGAPGFTKWSDGRPKIYFPHYKTADGSKPVSPVVVIPCRLPSGQINRLKFRVDDPAWQGGKYLSFTSSGAGGPTATAIPHVPKGTPKVCEVVRITEGERKADIAFALDGVPIVSIPGVSSHAKVILVLKELGAKQVLLAFDADCRTNPNVAKALRKLYHLLVDAGFDVGIEYWDIANGKGIDDLLVGGKIPNLASGQDAVTLLAEFLKSAGVNEPELPQSASASKDRPFVQLLTPGTRVLCGDRGNIGTVVSDDGGESVSIHFVSEEGNEVDVDIPRNDLKFTTGRSVVAPAFNLKIVKSGDLVAGHPQLRRPVIDGLLRVGEVANVISAPKCGKSWLVLQLALCVACGLKWLNRFITKRGKVLLVDNELHPETLAQRLPRVAMAMGLNPENYGENLSVVNLRGCLIDLHGLADQLVQLERGAFDLIILDAWYRLQPVGSDENSNGDVTALYNLLDSVAHKIGCAFVCVHHSSKGNQGEKSVTDVGSGAGAQARAPDTHLILRAHEVDNAVVVEAAVRSWPPLEPFCMRHEHPIWSVDEYLNPADLRKPKSKRTGTSSSDDAASREEVQKSNEEIARNKVLRAYETFPEGETKTALREAAGLSGTKFGPIHADLLREGVIESCKIQKNGRTETGFRLFVSGRTRSDTVGQKTLSPTSPGDSDRSVGQASLPLGKLSVRPTVRPSVAKSGQAEICPSDRPAESPTFDLEDLDLN